jgi:hypothetical protein
MKPTYLALAFVCLGTTWAQMTVHVRSGGSLPGAPFNGAVVTGKPFTADATSTSDQTLADGSHIRNQQTGTVARDSQGRTRREETLPAISNDGQPEKTVFISDPVAQVNYFLGPDNVAREFPFKPGAETAGLSVSTSAKAQQVTNATVLVGGGGMMTAAAAKEPGEATTESLGTQTISGVQATGTRITRTIPAGQIGNDAPLVITEERWYSQDLQALVMSKHSDPRFGESSFQLTNIQRTEPAASLFQVPSNYTVAEPETK